MDDATLERGLELALEQTNFANLGRLVRGKVRDSYIWDPPAAEGGREKLARRAIVVSDRISAFDHILGTVPFKGQVLSGITHFWFEKTQDVCANHLLCAPDPAASIVRECRPFLVEMVVRAYLTGSSPTSILTHYQRGERRYCGHGLPEGLKPHERLPEPLVTPTTKADRGDHDEPISLGEVVARGLASADQAEQLSSTCLALFARGQQIARSRGLILVDTKYELGLSEGGQLVLIDELHTPDSSRFWYAEGYEAALSAGQTPRALDKEFVRRELVARGFCGQGTPPPLDRQLRLQASRRYCELFLRVTGKPFEPNLEPPLARIERNLRPHF